MSLSMIVYLADVLPKLAAVLSCLAGFSSAFSGCALVFFYIELRRANLHKKLFTILCISAIVWVISLLIPSQNTIYLMAGANATQQLADTPEAAKARKALNLGLDKIIMNLQESK